jgi:hypothetical protein
MSTDDKTLDQLAKIILEKEYPKMYILRKSMGLSCEANYYRLRRKAINLLRVCVKKVGEIGRKFRNMLGRV